LYFPLAQSIRERISSAWVKLAAEHELPVLVLVGRDDLGLLN
jgi:hypothetical protein